jgi:hypothetical protein
MKRSIAYCAVKSILKLILIEIVSDQFIAEIDGH